MVSRNQFTQLSTYFLISEAEKLGFVVKEIILLEKTNIVIIEKNGIKHIIFGQRTEQVTTASFKITEDKHLTKRFLIKNDISTAFGKIFKKEDVQDAVRYASSFESKFVIKPNNGTQGKDVYIESFSSAEKITFLLDKLFSRNEELLIEEFSSGEEFRILATKDSLLGVIKRIPANVIGDGIKTIEQLITEKNTDPRRGDNYTYSLLKIIIDEEVLSLLQEQNLSLSSVPEKNERILLRKKSNISTGGDSIDVTDQIHKNIRVLATNIVRAIPSLPYAAIDFITKDISANPFDIGYSVVEINSSPMLSMHHEPYKGVPRNVSKEIIKLIDHE